MIISACTRGRRLVIALGRRRVLAPWRRLLRLRVHLRRRVRRARRRPELCRPLAGRGARPDGEQRGGRRDPLSFPDTRPGHFLGTSQTLPTTHHCGSQVDGETLHARFVAAAEGGGGWVSYSWRNAAHVKLSLKGAYIIKVIRSDEITKDIHDQVRSTAYHPGEPLGPLLLRRGGLLARPSRRAAQRAALAARRPSTTFDGVRRFARANLARARQ